MTMEQAEQIQNLLMFVVGEGIPSGEAQPSYSQCKPYVDAALKGEIPPEETPPSTATSTDTTKSVPQDDDDDDSGEEERQGHVESPTKSTKATPTPEAEDDNDSSEEVVV